MQLRLPKVANTRKWFTRVGTTFILLIATIISYVQIRDIALIYGRPQLEASLLPIIIDIFGIVAAFKVRESGITATARNIARICMWFAIGTSVANNLIHGVKFGNGLFGFDRAWSLFLAALPAIALLGLSEMLTHTHKRSTPDRKPAAPRSRASGTSGKGTRSIPRQRASQTKIESVSTK